MCKYCEEGEDIFIEIINKSAIIENNKLRVEIYSGSIFNTITAKTEIPINYCPMCGRKIESEGKDVKD